MSLMLLALVLVFAGGFVWYDWQRSTGGGFDASFPASTGAEEEALKSRVNVILIGADQRPEEKVYNTDSIIFASIDPLNQQVSLLSIPRDTKVHLLGHGDVKINSVASLEGLDTLQKIVSDLLDVPVNGYIMTNFAGFKKIIDTLGGITVNVEKDMYYETGDKEDGYINLRKGLQRLNGTQALEYTRFRYDALADISRTARQQVVLKAVAKEMFQLTTVPKIPVLIPQLMKAVQTNLTSMEILKLAKVAVGFDSSKVISQTLPGSFLDLEGISYWNVEPVEAKEVVRNLFRGIITDKVIDDMEVDLLKPIVPSQSVPKVPGNIYDPNGQKSPGHMNQTNGQMGGTGSNSGSDGGKNEPPSEKGWPLGPDGAA